MKKTTKLKTLRSLLTVIFAVIISLSVFTTSKTNAVGPYTSQDLFVILAGCILGGANGCGSCGLFLIIGCLGLKVFPGFNGGFEFFASPLAGYLYGFFIVSLLCGLICGFPCVYEKKFSFKNLLKPLIASVISYILIYLIGIIYFNMNSEIPLQGSDLSSFILELLPFTVLKIAIICILSMIIRPLIGKLLYPVDSIDEEKEEIMEKIKKRKKINDNIKEMVTKTVKKEKEKK